MAVLQINPFFRRLLVVAVLGAAVTALYAWVSLYTVPYHPRPGFSLDTFDDDFHQLHSVVLDVGVLACIQTTCSPAAGYTKSVALNTFDAANVRLYNYYLTTRRQTRSEAHHILVGLRFTPYDVDDGDLYDYESVSFAGTKLYAKYIKNTGHTIPDDVKLVYDVDVLFGAEDFNDWRPNRLVVKVPQFGRPQLARNKQAGMNGVIPYFTMLSVSKNDHESFATLMTEFEARRTNQEIPAAGSRFRILQLSDAHFGMNSGRCEGEACKSDLKTLKFIEDAIEAEKPQLVVITGDLFDIDRSPDYKLVLIKLLHPILKHKVPFVFTFGDADTLRDDPTTARTFKKLVVNFLLTLPNCYNRLPNDEALHGVSNYHLKIKNGDSSQALISILDSEDHRLDHLQMYFLLQAALEAHDTPLKLLFFNYPLPQYRPKGPFLVLGEYKEKGSLSNGTNPKFYDDIVGWGYKAVLVGHEHENDVCINSDKTMWLCFSSVVGDSAVTKTDDFARRLRVFDINFEKNQILTWKRREGDNGRQDPQMIYEL